jgi:hypothetical protein
MVPRRQPRESKMPQPQEEKPGTQFKEVHMEYILLSVSIMGSNS